MTWSIKTLAVLGSAFAHSGAKGIIKDRMELFKKNKDNLKVIKFYLGINMMTRQFNLAISLILVILGSTTLLSAETTELKPDDPVYAQLGKKVYQAHCASCHGVHLEGQAGWRDHKVDGMRLAPPHDKSGHTWHHPDELLYKLTKYGFKAMVGEDYKVSMPVYDGIINDQEIVAVLSYIKSTWPTDVREIHDKINSDHTLNKKIEKKMGKS